MNWAAFIDLSLIAALVCLEVSIEKYRRCHAGGRVLVLGNGPSWKHHDLSRIDCPIIGLNQAWRMRKCNYYVAADREQFEMYRREHGEVESWAPLFTTFRQPDDRPMPSSAIKLIGHHVNGRKRLSFDLGRGGVYLNHTVASYGLHLATYMLGDEGTIYLLGIDCGGPSFHGTTIPDRKLQNQRETLAYIRGVLDGARPRIAVYTLSGMTDSFAVDKMNFDKAFPPTEVSVKD